MKELQLQEKDRVEIVDESKVKKEVKLLGKQRKIPGLTTWQYNTVTNELKPAEFKKTDVVLKNFSAEKAKADVSHKINVDEDSIYIQALNRKNAIKQIKKVYPQINLK